ncbi:hypothetical protein [Paenibacillus thiaminolyticus]|uniref:Uncharacterized protein n=1 Tax=Paenibacillus thiaminolyticus TaxID=49283 RepID=A0A3A3GEM7_PANTH|nr:hypothetical protein [Paenibacillus thiaminolyticus]RJG21155.1 hypothetical protein DQX05_22755 [Paenibacillus thiaminolyticus]
MVRPGDRVSIIFDKLLLPGKAIASAARRAAASGPDSRTLLFDSASFTRQYFVRHWLFYRFHAITSRFPYDHADGVHDFTHASIYIDRREWEFGQRFMWRLLRKGYLKPLYNQINPSTINLLDFGAGCGSYGPFEHAIDLLSDGSLILVPLRGHTIGQYGLLLNQPDGRRYFLMADSVYVRANYRTLATGSWASRLAHYNARLYESLFPILRQLEESNPEMVCIPSHDSEAYEQYVVDGPQPF